MGLKRVPAPHLTAAVERLAALCGVSAGPLPQGVTKAAAKELPAFWVDDDAALERVRKAGAFIAVARTADRERLTKLGTPYSMAGVDGLLFVSSLPIQKQDELTPIGKPFGPYETFDACVLDQKAKGHDDDSARRICGALQAETEKLQKQYLCKMIPPTDSNGDRRIAFGVVLAPETTDLQGDIYSAEEIEGACHDWITNWGHFTIQHQVISRKTGKLYRTVADLLAADPTDEPVADQAVELLENTIVRCDETSIKIYGRDVKRGTWMAVVRYKNDELWAAVKDGRISGFSIGGTALKTPLSA